MEEKKIPVRPGLFAASGMYLLAAFGLWMSWMFSDTLFAHILGFFPGVTTETLTMLLSFLYYVPFVLLPAALWARRNGADAMRLNPVSLWSTIKIAVIAVLAVLIVQDFAVFWHALWQKLGLNVFVDSYIRPSNRTELTRSIISAAVIAPVCEETLFRGVLLPAWETRGAKRGVLVSAILFAILHGSLLGLPGQFFGGLLLALLVLWTDSLYAGLIFHSTYNAVGVIMNYISSGTAVDAAGEALMQTDIVAYMGGLPTLLVLVVDIIMMLAIIALLTRHFRLMYALRNLRDRGEKFVSGRMLFRPGLLFGEPEPADRSALSTGTTLVLMAGIVSSAGLYVLDILTMLGG